MRILIFTLFLGFSLIVSAPVWAQTTIEVNKSDRSQSATSETASAQKGIPLDGFWRSDSALIEAEKLSKEKKYAAAISILDQIIARNPRNSDAHVNKALAWLNLGHTDKAKLSIENALLADRNHMGAYVVSGLISIMQKDTQQAEYTLSALRLVCQGENCPEFQTLQRLLREMKT